MTSYEDGGECGKCREHPCKVVVLPGYHYAQRLCRGCYRFRSNEVTCSECKSIVALATSPVELWDHHKKNYIHCLDCVNTIDRGFDSKKKEETL